MKGIRLLHLVLALASSGMIWVPWWLTLDARRRKAAGYVLALELLAVATVVLTGHLGSFLSGVNGPGSTRRGSRYDWRIHPPKTAHASRNPEFAARDFAASAAH